MLTRNSSMNTLYASLALVFTFASSTSLVNCAFPRASAQTSSGTGRPSELPKLLEPGKTIEQSLKSGDEHLYEIVLGAGQYLNAVVEASGIDLSVTVADPDHRILIDGEKQAGPWGAARKIMILSDKPGRYSLKIKAGKDSANIGTYTIKNIEVRAATRKEQNSVEATNLDSQIASLVEQNNLDQAITFARRALSLREEFGRESAEVAESLHILAILYHRKRDYVQAEPLYRRAVAIYEKLFGGDDLHVAEVDANLGEMYKSKGDYNAAERTLIRVVEIREKKLDPNDLNLGYAVNNLGLLYQTRGEYGRAEQLFSRALKIFERAFGPDDPSVATVLNNLAEAFRSKGEYDKAEPLLNRAIAIHEKVPGEKAVDLATDLGNLGILYLMTGKYARSESALRRALAIYEKAVGPNDPNVSKVLSNLGELYRVKGEYSKAEPLYKRALEIDEKSPGVPPSDLAIDLLSTAALYRAKGEPATAESLYLRALEIDQKALGAEHPDVATVLNDLGELYQFVGDLAKAEPAYQRALSIYEKALGSEHPNVGTVLSNLSTLYAARGDYAKAIPFCQRALAIKEKQFDQNHPDVATAVNNLAYLYFSKRDYSRAEELFQRAQTIYENAFGPNSADLARVLDNRAMVSERRGDLKQAESLRERALAIGERVFGPDHPFVANIINNLGLIQYAKQDYPKAESLWNRALAIVEKSLGPDHPQAALTLDNLALLYEAQGNIKRAIACLTRADEIGERNIKLNLAGGSERDKLKYVAIFTQETDRTVTLSVQAARESADARRLALSTILRRKGRALDSVAEGVLALRRSLNTDDRKLLDQLTETRSRLANLVLGASGRDPSQDQTEKTRLEERAESLEARISSRSAEFRAQSQPVTIEAIQALIPPDSALVEFLSYKPFNVKRDSWEARRYVAFVLFDHGDPACVELGRAFTIDVAVDALRKALRSPHSTDTDSRGPRVTFSGKGTDPGNVKQLARRVDELVMEPIRRLLRDKRTILLSPDGALNLIPFAALVDEKQRYLLEDYQFIYLTTGRDLLRLTTRLQSQTGPLLLGNPDYDASAATKSQPEAPPQEIGNRRSGEDSTGPYPPLAGAEREVHEIGKLLSGASILEGATATEAALKSARSPSILHIATHGFFLPDPVTDDRYEAKDVQALPIENPMLRSGLALAGANKHKSGAEDGVLTALEASGLDLWGTKLVVLSACDTGVGDVRNGDGVYGLRRALVVAGSESQMMSLWQVSDEATRELMVDYYRGLEAGEGRAASLRRVQLKMLKSGMWKHPFYWASFIQSGEWANLQGKR